MCAFSEELAQLKQQQLVLETQLERTERQLEAARERAAVDRHKVTELQDQIRLVRRRWGVRLLNHLTYTGAELRHVRDVRVGWGCVIRHKSPFICSYESGTGMAVIRLGSHDAKLR